MGAITDLWKSERGFFAIFIVLCITVLASLGKITFDQWVEIVKWVSAFYIGSKTVTGAIVAAKLGPDDSEKPVVIK